MAAFTEPARGRAAAGEAPVAMATSAQFMITHAMRRTLIEDLGFAREEVEVLRPEIAAQLIQNETRRPFGDRSMPDDWKRSRSPPRSPAGSLAGVWSTRDEGAPGCGYRGEWRIASLPDGELLCEEMRGRCCFGVVPNCFPKRGCLAHRLAPSEVTGRFEGRLGGRPIRVEVVDEGTLRHVTTDGTFTLVRV